MNAMDKVISKDIFKNNKILSPKYFFLDHHDLREKKIKSLIKKFNLNYPIVVKPSDEGSSIGVKICKDFKTLKKSLNSA